MWHAVRLKRWSGTRHGPKNLDPSGRAALGVHEAAYASDANKTDALLS